MLLVYSKYTGKFPMDRFAFTMCLSAACMVILLLVAISHRFKHVEDELMDDEEFLRMKFGLDSEESEESLEIVNQFHALNTSEMERLSRRMEERRQMAKEACDRLGVNRTTEPNGWEFLINKQHGLIWCNIFKAASTTWLYNFNVLGGYTPRQAARTKLPQWLAREIYPRPSAQQLQEAHSEAGSLAFIIVRHPFERLSSAYRDKMLSGPSMGMYADLAEEIIMKHRKRRIKADESFLHQLWPTFEEFITFILTEAKNNRTLDVHWSPFTPFCTPCQFDFDVIVKFETFEEDQNYLVQRAGLENQLTPQRKNAGNEKKGHKGKNTTEILKSHYSQLTGDQISQLHELYKYDFEIFNYTVQEYYDMVKTSISDEKSKEGSGE